jgi:BioD-like phosphotransacetylase family protein
MAKKIFIGATDQHCGKTTMSLCLAHLARRRYGSVGFLKPVGQEYVQMDGLDVDKDVALMAGTFGLEADARWMSPVIAKRDLSRAVIDGQIHTEELSERILEAVAELEKRHDFLVIEGTGHGGVGAVFGLSNARVARLCEAPAVIVCKGGIGNAHDAVALNLALYEREGARVCGVLANKLLVDKRDQTLAYLRKAFRHEALGVFAALDWSSILASPTMANMAKGLGVPLHGDPAARNRIVHHIQLGAASTQRCVDMLNDSTLLVATSTRDELLVTLASLYANPDYRPKIAGMVVAGRQPVSRVSQTILDQSGVPYIRREAATGEVFVKVMEHIAKTGPEDREKIETIQREGERLVDFDAIDARL